MKLTVTIEKVFQKYLPSPFTIAVLLTLFTIVLALFFGESKEGTSTFIHVLLLWETGIWNNGLLVFAYQMMLILVLGHVLVLSKPVALLISQLTKLVSNASNAAFLVALSAMIVSFFNWGLGLIFGAILARKVGEYAQEHNIPINYPLVGASGYAGLMVWHGGISGSAPLKVAEKNHLNSLMENSLSEDMLATVPGAISTALTIFSTSNLLIFFCIVAAISSLVFLLGKKATATVLNLPKYQFKKASDKKYIGAEKLEYSGIFASLFGLLLLITFFSNYWNSLIALTITPNMLNFFMLGLAIVLHGSFTSFLSAVQEAIGDTSGILIQFPLYFGVMGIMSGSGIIDRLSEAFVMIATPVTLPIFSFFSAAIVNIFVPSGGGQWAVQGPVIIASAMRLGVPLPKAIMALAYGDQITNMLQPFWALPLLAITKLKAKEILPYTLLFMIVGIGIYIVGLLLF